MKEAHWLPAEAPAPVMYRTEDYSGEGFREPAEVLTHETCAMENADAVSYLLEHYLDPESELYDRGRAIEESAMDDAADELDEDEVLDFYDACLREIEARTGIRVTWCVWLASREAAVEFYGGLELAFQRETDPGHAAAITVDAYDTAGAVVLDDLGYDGMLLGFKGPREPVSRESASAGNEEKRKEEK